MGRWWSEEEAAAAASTALICMASLWPLRPLPRRFSTNSWVLTCPKTCQWRDRTHARTYARAASIVPLHSVANLHKRGVASG